MSTVLWANRLEAGEVVSDQSDKHALHRHLARLDKIAAAAGLSPISAFCDSTDLRFNLQDLNLPEGMASTNEWMARDGVWIDAVEAVRVIAALLADIEAKRPRFGLLGNDIEAVLQELREALAFARDAAGRGARFNFAVVM